MLTTRFVVSISTIAMMTLGASAVSAQTYPNKPIRIMASEAGGGTDTVARMIARALTESFGQPVVVENRGGVTLSMELVSKANPDGYTLLVGGSTLWTLPLLQKKPLWDPLKDFAPISLVAVTPSILAITPSSPIKSVKELIDLAKAKPGSFNYSASGIGSASHLGAELFKYMAGVNIVGVNYKSNAPAATAVSVGEVLMTIGGMSATVAAKAGRMRALAVGSLKPSPLWPGLPTIAETVPGYTSNSTTDIFAPGKTPPAIIKRLNMEVVRLISRPDIKKTLEAEGSDVIPSTPEEFVARIKSEMEVMGKMIKATGIQVD